MAEVFMLGGRAYRSAATAPTFAQRGFLMGVTRTHALDATIARDGDLLAAIFSAGCASTLLAALLVETDNAWTREAAIKNAAFFDGLTADEDHAALLAALEGLLAGFFPPSGTSSPDSPTSSTRAATGKAARKPRRRRVAMPAIDTASSPTSSPPSPSSADSA
jgi:hypothetical protein